MPNSISNGLAVFVWVPHATLYNAYYASYDLWPGNGTGVFWNK